MILVDSNVLMLCEQKKLRLPPGEYAIPEACVRELEKLSLGKGKKARAARIALEIIKRKNMEILPTSGEDCDPSLLEIARSGGFRVLTADKELIKKLRLNRIEILSVKDGKIIDWGD